MSSEPDARGRPARPDDGGLASCLGLKLGGAFTQRRDVALALEHDSHSRSGHTMTKIDRVFRISFASVYPLYVQKVEKKGRAREDVDEVICWLTGYNRQTLADQIERKTDLETFFGEAPALNPNASKITGVICGVRIAEIDDPLMRKIRYMDKLVDELAKGRPMAKILRA